MYFIVFVILCVVCCFECVILCVFLCFAVSLPPGTITFAVNNSNSTQLISIRIY
jgi:hypothetical protein